MWLWEFESHMVEVFNEGGLEDAEGEKVLKSMDTTRKNKKDGNLLLYHRGNGQFLCSGGGKVCS